MTGRNRSRSAKDGVEVGRSMVGKEDKYPSSEYLVRVVNAPGPGENERGSEWHAWFPL